VPSCASAVLGEVGSVFCGLADHLVWQGSVQLMTMVMGPMPMAEAVRGRWALLKHD
jgi:hypothetical protein